MNPEYVEGLKLMRNPAHYTDPVKKSILAVSEAQFAQLSDQERSNLEVFSDYAKKYHHRIAWPLSDDLFMRGLKEHLEQNKIKFARVPFASIDTVYYLFTEVQSVKAMFEFLEHSASQPKASATLN